MSSVHDENLEKRIQTIFQKLPVGVMRHSQTVSRKAVEIAERIQANGHPVDIEVVKLGGLLHDVARKGNASHGHGVDTGKILRKEGIPEAIVHAAEMHSYPNKRLEDMSIEAKIVKYADSRTKHDEWVSLEERFRDVIKRRMDAGMKEEAEKIASSKSECIKLEKEILKLAGCKSADEL